jgi:hypothetical protein
MNSFLKKLGLSEDTRAVIIHTDDIGMPCLGTGVQGFVGVWNDHIRGSDGPVSLVPSRG